MGTSDQKSSSSTSLPKTEVMKSLPGEPSGKPFPWPLLIAIGSLVGAVGLIQNYFVGDDTAGIRLKWDLVCSFVPGLSILAIIGALAQFKHRPLLSSLTILMGAGVIFLSYTEIQRLVANRWLF